MRGVFLLVGAESGEMVLVRLCLVPFEGFRLPVVVAVVVDIVVFEMLLCFWLVALPLEAPLPAPLAPLPLRFAVAGETRDCCRSWGLICRSWFWFTTNTCCWLGIRCCSNVGGGGGVGVGGAINKVVAGLLWLVQVAFVLAEHIVGCLTSGEIVLIEAVVEINC